MVARWRIGCSLLVAIVCITALAFWVYHRDDTSNANQLPAASVPTQTEGLAHDITIPPSQPLELVVPSTRSELTIDSRVDPMPTPCRSVIDPPRDAQRLGGIYSCQDFSLPGTNSHELSVIAGHAGQSIDTVFNKLYQRGIGLVNQPVSLRTAASGNHWLIYTVQAVYTPDKKQLPYMAEIWGAPGENTAGRLVLITCDIETNGSSPRNYVAVLQLKGVS